MRKLVVLFGLIIFLYSCEGIVGGDGKVIDSVTKKPIKGVSVVLYLENEPIDTSVSNVKGSFRGSEFVSCVPDCPKARIVLTKEKYRKVIIDFDEYWEGKEFSVALRDSMVIEMIKE